MEIATSIDEVINHLTLIIDAEVSRKSHLAFFPVLYKKVTERIKLGIQNKEFEDNERMERLDVIFASRYLRAYQEWKAGTRPSESWERAFHAPENDQLIIMQDLLLGINAHINLDLGIAAAQTVDNFEELQALKNDFNKINEILNDMVDGVQNRISEVSPIFYLLEKVGKGKEDELVSFSINIARDGAWLFANEYCLSPDEEKTILNRDIIISHLAERLVSPRSRLLRWTIRSIRFFEVKNVKRIAKVLGS